MKSIVFILATCFSSVLIHAQSLERSTLMNSFPKEEVTLIANDDVILSGQMLGYSIFCTINKRLGSISDIVYVELVSAEKVAVFKQKLLLKNGNANGDYFLPTTLKTGHYKLISYTAWTLNNSENHFYQKDIYIINPYLDAFENDLKSSFGQNEGFLEISKNEQYNVQGKNDYDGLKVETDADIYKKRSKVILKLQNNLNVGNYGSYSVLVKKIDSVDVQKNNVNKSSNPTASSSAHLPEMRGELIKGTVFNLKTAELAVEQTVSLSIAGEHHVYKSTTTNSKGEFYFNLFETYDQEKALIQVVSDNRSDYKLTVIPKVFDRYNELEFYPLKLNKNTETYITQNSIYNQVESAYYNIKRDTLMPIRPLKSFYGKPDKVYVLDDFTRFNSVKETFIEVVQEAAIRSINGGYQFLVYDYDDPFGGVFKNAKPLLLLDGIQIQDENILVNYLPESIESVSLVKGIYSIGSTTYNGIIDVKSKKYTDQNLSGSYLQHMDIKKPESQKIYFKQNYTIDQNRIPDYRTQLLWQPDVELKSNEKEIDFYTSDVTGYYIVEINGLTHDGKLIYLNEIFKVTN